MEVSSASQRLELEPMLKELLEKLEALNLDKIDILYSRSCRENVQHIIEWMLIHDFVDAHPRVEYPADDISLLRRAISYLAKSIRDKLGKQDAPGLFRSSLFYPLDDYVHISHHEPHYVNWENIARLYRAAFSTMRLSERVTMDSEAHSVMSLLYSRGMGVPLVRNMYGFPRSPGGGERTQVCPNTLRDKFVLVCCIDIPSPVGSRGVQSLFNLCHELSSLERGDVEIVMVARIHILCDAPELFKHVFKGLPSSCLVVPYEACEHRERLWKKLGFDTGPEFKCFSYDRAGLFYGSFCADGYVSPYGAEAFPFTTKMVEKVDVERKALRWGGSLEELLRPSYEDCQQDVVVYKFNERDGPERRISQVIENRHVGLYMCCRGNLIPRLHEVYEQCKGRNVAFKIVVLYLPSLTNLDPETFRQKMDGLLQEQQIGGWWCLPFNNSVSLRFWGLTKDYDIGAYHFEQELEDKLIIVGTDGKILDMYGAEIIKTHGIDGTYHPFTRTAFVEKSMREIRREMGLLWSLSEAQLFRGTDPDDVISGNTLSHKKVIIFMGEARVYKSNGIKHDFGSMVSQYEKMKNNVGDEFEVVFVELPIPGLLGAVDATVFSEIPWYVHCPLDGTYTALSHQLRDFVAKDQAIVGLGEDGRICSVKLLQKLGHYAGSIARYKTAGLCVEDTLFEDLHVLYGFDEYGDI